MVVTDAVDLVVSIINQVMPYAIAFGIARVLVRIFLKAAFGGRLDL